MPINSIAVPCMCIPDTCQYLWKCDVYTDKKKVSNDERLEYAERVGACLNCLNKHAGECTIHNRHSCSHDARIGRHQSMVCPDRGRVSLSVNSIDLSIEDEKHKEDLEYLIGQFETHVFPDFGTELETRSVNSITRTTHDTPKASAPFATDVAGRGGIRSQMVSELL